MYVIVIVSKFLQDVSQVIGPFDDKTTAQRAGENGDQYLSKDEIWSVMSIVPLNCSSMQEGVRL